MKKKEIKINKTRPIVQDIKRIYIKTPLVKDIKEETLVKKNLIFRLFLFIVIAIFITVSILFLYFKNRNSKTDEGLEKNFTYYTNKVRNTFSLLNFGTDEETELDNNEKEQEAINNENLGEALLEASSMRKSKNKDWWLNSGGIMYFQEKEFSTNIGPLPENSYWRKLYAKNNSRDTDDGYFPQNIFRLVSKKKWENFSQSIYFNIEKINLSKSKYRNESNGVLLFNRYQDGDNLYYAGMRVDGHIVVKKKINGEYFTLVEKNIFKDKDKYDRKDNPNLIPENTWIGIKSELENTYDDKVKIKVFIDDGNGQWDLAVEIKDEKDKYGNAPFLDKGYAGIRADFMDVRFRNYNVEKK